MLNELKLRWLLRSKNLKKVDEAKEYDYGNKSFSFITCSKIKLLEKDKIYKILDDMSYVYFIYNNIVIYYDYGYSPNVSLALLPPNMEFAVRYDDITNYYYKILMHDTLTKEFISFDIDDNESGKKYLIFDEEKDFILNGKYLKYVINTLSPVIKKLLKAYKEKCKKIKEEDKNKELLIKQNHKERIKMYNDIYIK